MNLSAQLETEDCQDDVKKKNSHILKDWMQKAWSFYRFAVALDGEIYANIWMWRLGGINELREWSEEWFSIQKRCFFPQRSALMETFAGNTKARGMLSWETDRFDDLAIQWLSHIRSRWSLCWHLAPGDSR